MILAWLEESSPAWPMFCCLIIALGCGAYGASIGAWRDPIQGLYAGIKFPLVIFLTVLVNALLNGAFGQLFGLRITFRQTSVVVLESFTIVGLILGAFAPISFFVLWHLPELGSDIGLRVYLWIILGHVCVIAYAGIAANLRLYRLIRGISNHAGNARRILFFWLVAGLFVGSQFSWILRPFIGSPLLDVEFLREDAFEGNFYESILRIFSQL